MFPDTQTLTTAAHQVDRSNDNVYGFVLCYRLLWLQYYANANAENQVVNCTHYEVSINPFTGLNNVNVSIKSYFRRAQEN